MGPSSRLAIPLNRPGFYACSGVNHTEKVAGRKSGPIHPSRSLTTAGVGMGEARESGLIGAQALSQVFELGWCWWALADEEF